MKRNIVLIGAMGTGKSHVGNLLAKQLNWQFIDTDRRLENEVQQKAAEYYQTVGEADFEAKEDEIIAQVRHYNRVVIAIGGNFLLREKNFNLLQEYGVVVLLYAKSFRIAERVTRKIGKRPTIDYKNVEEYVAAMNEEWQFWRGRADLSVNTTHCKPVQIVRKIQIYMRKSQQRFARRTLAKERTIQNGKENCSSNKWW